MNKIFSIDFRDDTKFTDIDIDLESLQIYIDKSTIGKNDEEKSNYNFLAVGRNNDEAKKLIACLANSGFFLTHQDRGISVFTKCVKGEEQNFLLNFPEETLLYNGVFYTLESPIKLEKNANLLVIFSSIADFPFNASISRRMFYKNFPNVQNSIPKNTYILRIADLGGVLGSFYLPSNFDPNFPEKIINLVEKIANDNNISKNNIVFYGSSKGATGALYNGIINGYKSICIDPIVSDKLYLEKYNDLHFVRDVFPRSKEEVFEELMKKTQNQDLSNIHIVTAPSSEQYQFVKNMVLDKNSSIKNYIVNDKSITHLNIANKTLNLIVNILNLSLCS